MAYFTLHLSSNEVSFEYSFPEEFLNKKFNIGLLKLDGKLKIDSKININELNFYYIVNGIDKNNNQIYEKNNIDIPFGKYDLNELVNNINSLLKRNKYFFNAKLDDDKVILDIKKAYSIDFNKNNMLEKALGFSEKMLSSGQHISDKKYSVINNNDNIFIWCNLIDDSYINNKKKNSLYRFRFDDNYDYFTIDPIQIFYCKV